MKKRATPDTLELRGLTVAPAQVWGGVRLVPLIRPKVPGDLRLSRRAYGDDAAIVSLKGELLAPGEKYVSYVPHGLVLSWSDDGHPVAALGGQLAVEREGKVARAGPVSVRVLHRMARREARNQLRLLPMHLAMEGFLALHFRGPDTAWSDWSRHALSHGLSPRWESAVSGRGVSGLQDALRVFEIHEGQCGVVVYVADALASAFVVPHPDDYRALHESLLLDFYAELFWHYSRLPGKVAEVALPPEVARQGPVTLNHLREALRQSRETWAALHREYSHGLMGRPLRAERVYEAGPFLLSRFLTELDPAVENHIGEAITRADGTLEYLKTFRLSAAQVERARLLELCAAYGWRLEQAAVAAKTTRELLIRRLCRAGFGYLLKKESVRQAFGGEVPGWVVTG